MRGSLVDTNVISEFEKPQGPHQAVKDWLSNVDNQTLYVRVLALAEVRIGIEELAPGRRRMNLERWFEDELLTFFQDRILPITYAIADRWAVLSSRLERRGKTQPIFDSFMAVTALEHDLAVVTRNVKDFVDFGVEIINPWAG